MMRGQRILGVDWIHMPAVGVSGGGSGEISQCHGGVRAALFNGTGVCSGTRREYDYRNCRTLRRPEWGPAPLHATTGHETAANISGKNARWRPVSRASSRAGRGSGCRVCVGQWTRLSLRYWDADCEPSMSIFVRFITGRFPLVCVCGGCRRRGLFCGSFHCGYSPLRVIVRGLRQRCQATDGH